LPLHDWLSKLANKQQSVNSQHYVATVRTVGSPVMVELADETGKSSWFGAIMSQLCVGFFFDIARRIPPN